MKKNRLLVLIGLAIASFALLTGFKPVGGGGHHGGHGFFGEKLERVLTEIDATEAQRTQIEAIKDRLLAQMHAEKGDRQQMREQRRQEVRSFWTSDQVSAEQLRARIDERLEKQRARAYAMADAMVEVHGILTPEQRTELAGLMEKHAAEHEHGKRGHGEHKGKTQVETQPESR